MGEHFGLGFVSALPSGANATAIPFGILEGITIDFSVDYKKYRGQYAYPKIVAAAGRELTGKVDSMSLYGSAIAQITGGSPTAGKTCPGFHTASVPAAAGPYTITVTNSATYVATYGVLDNTTNLYMSEVASNPTTGQYAVSAGVYTFAAADTLHSIYIVYTYTVAGSGKTVAITNPLMAVASGIQLVAFDPSTSGNVLGVKVFNAYFPKWGVALKAEDLAKQSVDFFGADNGSGSVWTVYTGE